jgi:phosphatidylglycerol:prolipoprotein diacylglycerol transferase
MAWFARRYNKAYLQLGDFVAPLIPLGLAAGRLGNFINAELWGRTTDVPWAVMFPGAGLEPRHPSQLYHMLLEGVLLFVVIMLVRRFKPATGMLGGVFLTGYGCARFFVEFFREPDAHLGELALGMTMGQWLCLPMIIGGTGLMLYVYRQGQQQKGVTAK